MALRDRGRPAPRVGFGGRSSGEHAGQLNRFRVNLECVDMKRRAMGYAGSDQQMYAPMSASRSDVGGAQPPSDFAAT